MKMNFIVQSLTLHVHIIIFAKKNSNANNKFVSKYYFTPPFEAVKSAKKKIVNFLYPKDNEIYNLQENKNSIYDLKL